MKYIVCSVDMYMIRSFPHILYETLKAFVTQGQEMLHNIIVLVTHAMELNMLKITSYTAIASQLNMYVIDINPLSPT